MTTRSCPAVAAGTFFLRQWILDALPRQELGEHDPFLATLQRSIAGRWRLFVGRFLGGVFRIRFVRGSFQRLRREQVPLIRVRCKAFTTRREEGLLQERDLLGGAFELLVIVLDRHLLLGDDFPQFNDHPLAVGQARGKIGTSVLHALLNPAGVANVSTILRFFRKKKQGASGAGDRAAPPLATPHAGQFDPFEDQSQITDTHLDAARRRRRVGLLDVSPTARRLERSGFQLAVDDHQTVSGEIKNLHPVAAAIEEQEQVPRLDRLPKLRFDNSTKPVETFSLMQSSA